ncbi:CBN-SET-3 protein [Caenorhabditis brenneri]|uniref:CBN-SET-3 protein n=1 Tax=Caenorhabditis brenneri TaxID=135651 RepID=G0MK86_CAEBE|nr:CBN-SET-3 protein [Caenorhabditis brenneri]
MVNVPSFRPNADFPQLCNMVTVGWDEKRGRFIKAIEDIPMGTVVCVEEGITVNVDPRHCYKCLAVTNDSEYAYCSTCEEFYEPDEIAQGNYDDLGIFKLATHLVFTYPFVDMLDLVQKSEDPKPAAYAPKSLSTSEIASVYQLIPFPDIGETFKLPKIQRAIKEIVISLENDENWGRLDFNARRMTFVKGLRIMAERCAKNAHTIYSISQKESDDELPIGAGLFPIASIFNHSCTPNVFAFFERNTFIFVSRGVKAGEELVDSYGVTYQQNTLQQRTEFLASVSGFQCHCYSCEERKNVDELIEENFDDIETWAKSANAPYDLSQRLEFMDPGSKEIENFIIAFSRRKESEIFMESMFEFWKIFVKNTNTRGIDYDPYLVRPYIEMIILAWSNEVECTEEEKASILIKKLVDEVQKGDERNIQKTVEDLRWRARTLWKSDESSSNDYS